MGMLHSFLKSALLLLIQTALLCSCESDFFSRYNSTLATTGSFVKFAKKKIFKPGVRLMFIAGLEGTGHHAIMAMFETCLKPTVGAELNLTYCESEPLMSTLMMNVSSSRMVRLGLFFADDTDHAAELAGKIQTRMAIVANRTGEHLYFVGLERPEGSGMLSYPSFGGVDKSLNHPDLFALSILAEKAGLDFRVLVLQRDAKEILRSVHSRHFGGHAEPKILVDNAAALYTQLALMDPAFYHCVKYNSLSSLSDGQTKELTDFLHPTVLTEWWPRMVKKVEYAHSRNSSSNSSHFHSAAHHHHHHHSSAAGGGSVTVNSAQQAKVVAAQAQAAKKTAQMKSKATRGPPLLQRPGSYVPGPVAGAVIPAALAKKPIGGPAAAVAPAGPNRQLRIELSREPESGATGAAKGPVGGLEADIESLWGPETETEAETSGPEGYPAGSLEAGLEGLRELRQWVQAARAGGLDGSLQELRRRLVGSSRGKRPRGHNRRERGHIRRGAPSSDAAAAQAAGAGVGAGMGTTDSSQSSSAASVVVGALASARVRLGELRFDDDRRNLAEETELETDEATDAGDGAKVEGATNGGDPSTDIDNHQRSLVEQPSAPSASSTTTDSNNNTSTTLTAPASTVGVSTVTIPGTKTAPPASKHGPVLASLGILPLLTGAGRSNSSLPGNSNSNSNSNKRPSASKPAVRAVARSKSSGGAGSTSSSTAKAGVTGHGAGHGVTQKAPIDPAMAAAKAKKERENWAYFEFHLAQRLALIDELCEKKQQARRQQQQPQARARSRA